LYHTFPARLTAVRPRQVPAAVRTRSPTPPAPRAAGPHLLLEADRCPWPRRPRVPSADGWPL